MFHVKYDKGWGNTIFLTVNKSYSANEPHIDVFLHKNTHGNCSLSQIHIHYPGAINTC